MKFYTEKIENTFNIKCDDGDWLHTIGHIEKPYHNNSIYVATNLFNETLKDGDTPIFSDFETAKNAIIDVFKEVYNR